jgi:SAM-dependent methyltransferase
MYNVRNQVTPANSTDAPIEQEVTACLACGSPDAVAFLTLSDQLLGLPGTFRLVRCRACRLVYQNPRPTEAGIAAYYPPEYDPFVAPPWAERRLLHRLLQLYGPRKRWRLVERWAPPRNGPRTILDVGCATGTFLAAGSHNWHKVGVELTEDAARLARETYGLTVHQGTLEMAPLAPRSFDVITMWDVVEHLHHPRETLRRVRELLRPDGSAGTGPASINRGICLSRTRRRSTGCSRQVGLSSLIACA